MNDRNRADIELSGDPFAEENPYSVLGVDRSADRSVVKKAYRALQRKAKRGDELWMKIQHANESLTKPAKRLKTDLFVVYERKLYNEIQKRYGDVSFDLVPEDLTPALVAVSDLSWAETADCFELPEVPKTEFEEMVPDPPSHSEVFLIGRRK